MKDYSEKKAHFSRLLTIYGRKPVEEALSLKNIQPVRLHLAENNKSSAQLSSIVAMAEQRGCEIHYHDRMALSRISKNRKQDQGVALDIASEHYQNWKDFIQADLPAKCRLLALDNIHNPQNLGMILRSAAAGFIDAVILPEKGCADISPLVIKASAGAVFHCPVIRCERLAPCLQEFKQQDFKVMSLELESKQDIYKTEIANRQIFVLGNESDGVSAEVSALSDANTYIPMKNEVESLNLAVSAALIAYLPQLQS